MDGEDQNSEVTGRIVISGKIPAFREAVAHVYLEDTTYADTESVTVAETSVEEVEHHGKETIIPFRLRITDESRVSPKKFYSVRVWVDISSGEPGRNDLFSDRAYRVLTHGFGNFVEVRIGN